MASIQAPAREEARPVVDKEGFLLNPETWSRDVAQILAGEEATRWPYRGPLEGDQFLA